MKAIVAMGRNRVIGLNDKLPWPPIKEDFKWFKEFTINNTIVIGKKTFDTLPPLKDRNIIVITNSIKEFEFIVEYLEKVEKIMSGMGFDIKNIIEIQNLEQL